MAKFANTRTHLIQMMNWVVVLLFVCCCVVKNEAGAEELYSGLNTESHITEAEFQHACAAGMHLEPKVRCQLNAIQSEYDVALIEPLHLNRSKVSRFIASIGNKKYIALGDKISPAVIDAVIRNIRALPSVQKELESNRAAIAELASLSPPPKNELRASSVNELKSADYLNRSKVVQYAKVFLYVTIFVLLTGAFIKLCVVVDRDHLSRSSGPTAAPRQTENVPTFEVLRADIRSSTPVNVPITSTTRRKIILD